MACKVDFYVLQSSEQSPLTFACQLVYKAWSQGHSICVAVSTATELDKLDELMWRYPEGRFLPHALAAQTIDQKGIEPIILGTMDQVADLEPARSALVNLTPQAVTRPERYQRLLEVVPFADSDRTASRQKFKTYRNLGLESDSHEMKSPASQAGQAH
jgi:DNA polymerase-3 subunit chi